MKLVQILARELDKWPEGSNIIVQDDDGEIKGDDHKTPTLSASGNVWLRHGAAEFTARAELASDRKTAIVTRSDWEAERARIAKPAKKASAGRWVRHRGGKCPVSGGLMIQTVMRGETKRDFDPRALFANAYYWEHKGDASDVMYWRIHKPAEQSEAKNPTKPRNSSASQKSYLEPCVLEKAAQNGDQRLADGIASLDQVGREAVETPEGYGEVITATLESTSGPLDWRDRIHEIDAEVTKRNEAHRKAIEALEEERASFVQRLEDEGLQLFQGKVCGGVQPVEDMSDWRNWKAGDLITCMTDEYCGVYEKGKSYAVKEFKDSGALIFDDCGPGSCCTAGDKHMENFKFHFRPSA